MTVATIHWWAPRSTSWADGPDTCRFGTKRYCWDANSEEGFCGDGMLKVGCGRLETRLICDGWDKEILVFQPGKTTFSRGKWLYEKMVYCGDILKIGSEAMHRAETCVVE